MGTLNLNIFKRITLLHLCLICPVGYAGQLVLKTELYEFICKVEVAIGPESPDIIEQLLEFPGVQSTGEYLDSIVYKGEGRLCYRRSSVVDDCYSEMNDWACYTNYSDESETILIY